MTFQRFCGIVGVAALATAARAEIISISGDVEAILEQRVDESPEELDSASERFPGTSSELPINAVVQRLENPEIAAGSAAAQLADPTLATGANPEEIAMNFSIITDAADRFNQARTRVSEERVISFSPEELPGTAEGDVATITGQVSLDGALVIISRDVNADLSRAFARFNVTVEQSGAGNVFSGEIELQGAAGGDAMANATGDIPANGVTIVDLGLLNPEVGRLWVVVFNQPFINYQYEATVGSEFTLTTTMKLDAQTAPDGTGVAGVIGTPFASLGQVIGITMGEEPADLMFDTISAERDNPSGQAIADAIPMTGLCGLSGVALTLSSLCGIGLSRRRRDSIDR